MGVLWGFSFAISPFAIQHACSDFVLRLKSNTNFAPLKDLPLTAEDRAAGVVSDRIGRLSGSTDSTPPGATVREVVILDPWAVFYAGENINGLSTADRVRRGIAPVPEARRLFPRMTIRENLEMGAFTRDDKQEIEADLERVFTLFPRIKERLGQAAGTLSGG